MLLPSFRGPASGSDPNSPHCGAADLTLETSWVDGSYVGYVHPCRAYYPTTPRVSIDPANSLPGWPVAVRTAASRRPVTGLGAGGSIPHLSKVQKFAPPDRGLNYVLSGAEPQSPRLEGVNFIEEYGNRFPFRRAECVPRTELGEWSGRICAFGGRIWNLERIIDGGPPSTGVAGLAVAPIAVVARSHPVAVRLVRWSH